MARFRHYPQRPARLTPEFVRTEYRSILDGLPAADAAGDARPWLAAIERWNALRSYVESERSRSHYAYSKDCLDPALEEEERYLREDILPVQEEGESHFLQALAQTPHRGGIAARHGQYFLDRLAAGQQTVAPLNSDLRMELGELATQYDKAVAAAEVTVGGEAMTLTRAVGIAQAAQDGELRREAFAAHRGWYVAQRELLGDLYARMVALRDRMGRNLGHATFTPLGYAAMSRTDYGPAEAARFRRAVREHFVPLQRQLHARQQRELGVASLRPWDAAFHPSLGIPLGAVPVAGQLDAADRVFAKLSPRLAGHFRRMRAAGLIDLENRKGKRGGGFCTAFPDEAQVAIFCNSTGQATDVRTLTHEMGHAFQALESQPIELVELQWPTADAAEIHSMGMEYLSLRHMDEFFADPEHARRFRRKRWIGAVELICYIAVVDEFQHWVYENPTATAAERDAQWDRAWETYIPGIDFSGVEQYRAARWYAQLHIFRFPFYYIDYAIAETGAMQLAMLDARDRAGAMDRYLALCRMGGTRGLLDIFRSADLRSPFDDGVMADLAAQASRECALS